jgi:hypothetical protein
METPNNPRGSDPARPAGSPVAGLLTVAAGFLTALTRLVPHPGNFSAMGGLGLFGGARLRSWQAFALPLVVMAASDCALWVIRGGNPMYSPFHESRIWVYASFLIYVLIGRALARTNSPVRIGLAAVLGSLQFFLITNFYSWLADPSYTRDFTGLMTCYLAGLPFYDPYNPVGYFGWTLLGDVGFTALLFGAYALATRAAPVPEPAAADEPR